jgi:hypothetical protein
MEHKNKTVDILTIVHFILYFILGVYFPNNKKEIFMFMILWELFEHLIVVNKTTYNLAKKYWIIPERYWNESMGNKLVDIVANVVGYSLGSRLRI